MAESYASGTKDPSLKAVVLFGSFIPDQGNRVDPKNDFPVPALCAMGTLDGGFPYAFRYVTGSWSRQSFFWYRKTT